LDGFSHDFACVFLMDLLAFMFRLVSPPLGVIRRCFALLPLLVLFGTARLCFALLVFLDVAWRRRLALLVALVRFSSLTRFPFSACPVYVPKWVSGGGGQGVAGFSSVFR
jgi:hypothetical protein